VRHARKEPALGKDSEKYGRYSGAADWLIRGLGYVLLGQCLPGRVLVGRRGRWLTLVGVLSFSCWCKWLWQRELIIKLVDDTGIAS